MYLDPETDEDDISQIIDRTDLIGHPRVQVHRKARRLDEFTVMSINEGYETFLQLYSLQKYMATTKFDVVGHYATADFQVDTRPEA